MKYLYQIIFFLSDPARYRRIVDIRDKRKKAKYYDVQNRHCLSWNFKKDFEGSIRVLAMNHRDACVRAKKRGMGIDTRIDSYSDLERYSKWKVKLSDKPNHYRHVVYY